MTTDPITLLNAAPEGRYRVEREIRRGRDGGRHLAHIVEVRRTSMSMTIEETEGRDQGGQITRRDLLLSLLAAVIWKPGRAVAQPRVRRPSSQDYLPVRVSTLNHVTFGCADLASTVAWYERVLGIPRYAFQDYGGGQTVLRIGRAPPPPTWPCPRETQRASAPPHPGVRTSVGASRTSTSTGFSGPSPRCQPSRGRFFGKARR